MPLNSNEKFLEAFKDYSDRYVIIGGTATSLILHQNGLNSRSTKDYDLVIIEEEKDRLFYQAFINFIYAGEYTPNKIDEKGKLYRFKTKNPDYPAIIELFCVTPNWFSSTLRTAPVHFDEDMSLSALLLDKDYYDILLQGKINVDGYSVLDSKRLIVFKAKAWLDLTKKREQGTLHVDSRNIKKHLNDIARLLGSLEDLNSIPLNERVQEDMIEFLDVLKTRIDDIPQNEDILFEKEQIYEMLTRLMQSK
ncbi:TPA: hypothetical protein ACNKKJ_002638 [Enterococcus faecalis]|uniref:hypothetical protein n=1 Tax=Enterococcus faecalis TaxID=1351 RepID=UPI00115AF143|nr:hypothetical protein [Enterococcus faecalis]EGO6085841.1 hypothetical protein [Enterococcus faecalis]EGO8651882.1 hypothetical protein [Enterococcus faecalis]EGO8717442.1 hypothetical protein [Enterococcus faecalis]EGO8956825.1 hypothetical protein [Enterococcus faecalis]EIT2197017.1 hypothetical protein [Enterococcus faecalis]